jgi:hypothetical protein
VSKENPENLKQIRRYQDRIFKMVIDLLQIPVRVGVLVAVCVIVNIPAPTVTMHHQS